LKYFFYAVILLGLLFNVTFADNFVFIKKFSLKKDMQKKILVKYGDKKKLFKFRWTLYKNDGLIILRSYDKIVAQNILYLNHINQSFTVQLMPSGIDYNVPSLMIKFKKFDFKKNRAFFDIYLSDDKLQLTLKYLKK